MGANIIFRSPFMAYDINNKEKSGAGSTALGGWEMSYVVWSRKCRKCNGQFFLDQDEDGYELVCIQCGFSERVVDDELIKLLSAIHPTPKKAISKAKTRVST
jgi:hypothetical protein